MKRTLISFAVASVMGLTACSQDSGSTSEGIAGSDSSQVAAKAQLRLSVKFPDSDRAQAALIDDNASIIAVKIRQSAGTTVEEFDEIGQLCGEYYREYKNPYPFQEYFDNLSEEDQMLCDFANPFDDNTWTVLTVMLDPVNNSATVEVPVGKYEIYAAQYANQVDLVDDRRISGAKSFADLTEGTHSVSITMTHGTWDFVNAQGVATPLEFQLLNNAAVMTEFGVTDFDPHMAGDQTPGELLGLTGDLAGFHLVDNRYFNRMAGHQFNYGAESDQDSGIFDALLPRIVTIPRIVDALGDETDVIPEYLYASDGGYDEQSEMNIEPTYDVEVALAPGFHLQQYDGTDNTNMLTFADYWADVNDYASGAYLSAGLLVKTPYDFPSNAMDDGTNWSYDINNGGDNTYVDEQFFTNAAGEADSLFIAEVSTNSEDFTHPNTDDALTDHPDASTTDGTTITGTLIEIVEMSEQLASSGVSDPAYAGDDPAPVAARAAYTAYRLDKAARSAGLKATAAASTYGTNCVQINDESSWYSNEFAWIGDTWVPGMRNYTYSYNGFEVTGSDLDRDGSIEFFESVFNNNGYYNHVENVETGGNANSYMEYDDATGTSYYFYALTEHDCAASGSDMVCTDLGTPVTDGTHQVDTSDPFAVDPDDDGRIEIYEEAVSVENETGTIHACIHEFTLKGRQLDMDIQTTTTDVVIN